MQEKKEMYNGTSKPQIHRQLNPCMPLSRCSDLFQLCAQIIRNSQSIVHLALQLASEQNRTVGRAELSDAIFDFGSEMAH